MIKNEDTVEFYKVKTFTSPSDGLVDKKSHLYDSSGFDSRKRFGSINQQFYRFQMTEFK